MVHSDDHYSPNVFCLVKKFPTLINNKVARG